MGLEPETSALRVERSTAELKNEDAKNYPRGGMIVFHPQKKRLLYEWKLKNWDTNNSRGAKCARKWWEPLLSRGYLLLYLLYVLLYACTYCCARYLLLLKFHQIGRTYVRTYWNKTLGETKNISRGGWYGSIPGKAVCAYHSLYQVPTTATCCSCTYVLTKIPGDTKHVSAGRICPIP